jgi:DNA-binding response OmpR family regulator
MGKSFQETEKLRILIIEDDLRYRSIVSQSLPECEKSFANDSEAGWSLFTQVAPDIIFLDLTFPGGLSGLTLLRKIRDFDPKSYVVIITASQVSADFNTAMRLGASGYITKPFSTKSLSDYVKKYMALNPGNALGITRRRLYDEHLERLKLEPRNQTTDESNALARFDQETDQRFSLGREESANSKLYEAPFAEESLIDKRLHLPELVSKWRILVAAGDDGTIKNVTDLLEKTFLIKPDVAQNSDDALRMLLNGRYHMAMISLKFHPKSGYRFGA